MLTIGPRENDQREETPVGIENGENEANQLYRRVPRVAIGGMGAVMATVTPHENDLREETHAAVKTAKTKPINCIDGSGSDDRRGGTCDDRPRENDQNGRDAHRNRKRRKRSQSIVSTVPRVAIGGMGAVRMTITPRENDLREETPGSESKRRKRSQSIVSSVPRVTIGGVVQSCDQNAT